jgi:hypothetical protein
MSPLQSSTSKICLGEKNAVYCERNAKHANTLRVQNGEFLYFKAGSTNSNNWASKG